jgi:hypothetical protein
MGIARGIVSGICLQRPRYTTQELRIIGTVGRDLNMVPPSTSLERCRYTNLLADATWPPISECL